jgi:hypothetical protein
MSRKRNRFLLVAAAVATTFAIGLLFTRGRHRHAG